MKFCTSCGAEIQPGMYSCTRCGAKLTRIVR
ncbi:MAG: zinc-ribbon domain-containing protein [Candidatus Heimdallarchaeota archaeon]|nr:zinc-ribbon domain-containing protein [Candidatus Heimdallarchaeota archaeon]